MVRGWVCSRTPQGGALALSDRIADRHDPLRDVRIKTISAGLNRADLLHVKGVYMPPNGEPDMPGLEAFGVALDVPPGSALRPGDKVCALLSAGAFSEEISVPGSCVFPVPEGLTEMEAGGFPEAYAAAYYGMMERGGLSAGQAVCVHAAASGLGLAAVHLAKAAGAFAVGMVRNKSKSAAVLNAGADACLVYGEDDADAVTALFPDGVDVVLDCLGKAAFDANARMLKVGGTLVSVGFLAGSKGEWNLAPVILKRLTIAGCALRSLPLEDKRRILDGMRRLYAKAALHGAKPVVDSVYPFEALPEALERMRGGEHIGKIILRVGGD